MSTQTTHTVEVNLGDRSYPVHVGADLLMHIGRYAREHSLGSRALIISNDTVGPLYSETIRTSLEDHGFAVDNVSIPDGEVHKTIETAASLYDACVSAGLDRSSFIVALGGGVVGDVAGFVAATYMRGVDFVQVPTTLLAQVDASVGGKTGVNHPAAKNMIGSFHQPRLVVADVSTLESLPPREYRAGLAEVVKHGLIADPELFSFVEEESEALLEMRPDAMSEIIVRSVQIKAEVVASDEKESGHRAILNFGHTIGHGVEAASDYAILHGEAIAIGMHVEARLSKEKGLTRADLERIVKLLERLELPTRTSEQDMDRVFKAMAKDKKAKEGRLRFALLEGIGRAVIADDVSANRVQAAYREAAQ